MPILNTLLVRAKASNVRFGVLPYSSLCQNGKQVEIITKEHLNFVI